MKLRRALAILGCISAMTGPIFAQSDVPFAKANQDFDQGHFQEAAHEYEGLVRAKEWSPALFYNLGNAYFRLGDFGRAILNYRRALALDPHHPESTANLRVARDEAAALPMQPDWLERHLQFAGPNQYMIAAAVAFWIGVFCFAGAVAVRNRRTAGMVVLVLLAFTTFGVTAFAAYRLETKSANQAIVTGKDVTARVATADSASSVLALPAGSEVRFLSNRGDWTYVELPNDQRGWIPARDAERIRL